MSIVTSTPSAPEMADCLKPDVPSLEKMFDMYKIMSNDVIELRKICQSQQETIRILKRKQYETEMTIENMKIILKIHTNFEVDNITNADLERATKCLQNINGKKSSADCLVAREDISTSDGEFERQKISEEEINLENIAAGLADIVVYDILPCSIDHDTTLRTLLTIASQKKMIVEHFYKEWSNEIGECLEMNGFKRSLANPYLYVKPNGESAVYWTRYTKNFLIGATDIKLVNDITNILQDFDIKYLGNLTYLQEMEIRRTEDGIFHINQSKFIEKLFTLFGLQDAGMSSIPLNPGYLLHRQNKQAMVNNKVMPNNLKYQKLMALLSHLAMQSRPDIAVSVKILSQYMDAPWQSDWNEAKKIVRYLKATANYELRLGQNNEALGLIGYADANWISGLKSYTGYLFQFGGSPISWGSYQQIYAATSSVDAECIALEEATRKGLWLQSLIEDFKFGELPIPIVYEDNQKCLKLVDSDEFNKSSNNPFDLTFNMKKIKQEKIMIFKFWPSIKMIADMLTKPLAKNKLRELAKMSGLEFDEDLSLS